MTPQATDRTDGPLAAESGTSQSVVVDQTSIRDPLIGVMLGEYQVLAPLGEGGMGQVYRGLQPVIGKPVAIKMLKAELASNQALVSGLIAEARAVNAIRHPGIVDVFSFGQAPDGRQYMVMELVDGQPLDQYLHAHGALPAYQAIEILTLLLEALGAAHDAGVIHRDLKPANLINHSTSIARAAATVAASAIALAPCTPARALASSRPSSWTRRCSTRSRHGPDGNAGQATRAAP